VLFIISDDLTATALSCYGKKICHTPNIDRLAAQGTRFTRVFCQGTYCGPSRASLLSGYYPHATGVLGYTSPRPAIGERATWPQHFKNAGDAIVMIRTSKPSFAASEYAATFGIDHATLSPIDLAREKALIGGLVAGAELGLIRSAHDVSEGGLAVAIAEACFNSRNILGARIDAESAGIANEVELFGEGASTVVISIASGDVARIEQLFAGSGLEVTQIGEVISDARLKIGGAIDEDVRTLMRIYEDAIPRRLDAGD
jgi:hypothetical protein